jgi:hypothetical protein
MRRPLVLLLALVFAVGGMMAVYAGIAPGPAPNSGDGISDGSGLTPMPVGPGETPGPAPSAGDGIPDGSGF